MSSQGQKLRAVGPEHLRGSPAEWEPAGKRGRLLLDAPSGPGLQTGLLGAAGRRHLRAAVHGQGAACVPALPAPGETSDVFCEEGRGRVGDGCSRKGG